MASDQGFHDFAVERLGPLGDITSRATFGGWSIFEHDIMFALISGASLFFKADDTTRATYEAAGSEPYGRMPYYEAPGDVLEDPVRLEEWARGAMAVAHSALKKTPKKASKQGPKQAEKQAAKQAEKKGGSIGKAGS